MTILPQEFKVFRKSENTNSFGLYQMFVMDKQGHAYKIHGSYLNARPVGQNVIAAFNTSTGRRAFHGFELVEKLSERAPKEVIDEVWKS